MHPSISRSLVVAALALVLMGCTASTRSAPSAASPSPDRAPTQTSLRTTAEERAATACGLLRFHLTDRPEAGTKAFDYYASDLARELFVSAVATSSDPAYAKLRRLSDGFKGESPRPAARRKALAACDRAGMTEPATRVSVRGLACRMTADLAANRPTPSEFAAGNEGHFFDGAAAGKQEPFGAYPRAISLALVMLPMLLDDDWSQIPEPGVDLALTSETEYVEALASLQQSC